MENEEIENEKTYDYFLYYYPSHIPGFLANYQERLDERENYYKFLENFSEVEVDNFNGCIKVAHNLVRKLKIKNLNEGLDDSYKKLVISLTENPNIKFVGNKKPSSGTSGSCGSSGTSGNSGSYQPTTTGVSGCTSWTGTIGTYTNNTVKNTKKRKDQSIFRTCRRTKTLKINTNFNEKK